MPASALHNRRGFFSDYWLGSMLARRETGAPRLTRAKLDKLLWRVGQLTDRANAVVEKPDLTTFRERFARPLLDEVWGFRLSEPTDEARLRLLLPNGDSVEPVAVLRLCPDPEELETREARQQLEHAVEAAGLTHGFLLSPSTLRVIHRPGIGPKGAAFDVAIDEISQEEDRESLEAARKLLHASNFVSRENGSTVLAEMEAESLRHRATVSAALKGAVFEAAEVIIRGFRADFAARREALPPEPPLEELRDTALLLLYRLLFILYAESRDDRLQRHTLYRRLYSLESLVDRLLRTPPDALARNRCEYWSILTATFRIFDEGLPPLPELENIPPRGGPLFDPETPGGQWLEHLCLSDADTAQLLFALATARPRRGVGRERISYRELAIEQLGSVYEGLLEYEPRLATETLFAIRVAGRELTLAPGELTRLCAEKELTLAGPPELVDDPLLADLHQGGSKDHEGVTLEIDEEEENHTDDPAEGDEETEEKGIKRRAYARLQRRLEPGEFFFTPGGARKSSGSYYTRDEIVQYLCREALRGRVEDASPEAILRLRVIDIACGSAHFLVGAARYLGAALRSAYQRAHADEPPTDFLPDHRAAIREARWEAEADAWCKRRVVEQCLFGVDLNPTAVELARVALWIESLAGDRPLTFFAHHVRCGNSLLGTSLATLHKPPLPGRGGSQSLDLFAQPLRTALERAREARTLIDAGLPRDIRPDTPEEYRYKADRLAEADAILDRARLLYDLRSASAFLPDIWRDFASLLAADDPEVTARERPWWPEFDAIRNRERFFHWELEFPEVFSGDRPGFDVVLGNPPWDKVLPAKLEFYARHDLLIRAFSGGELDRRIRELHREHPGLEEEFRDYESRTKIYADLLRKGGDFPLSKGGALGANEDVSRYFIERSLHVMVPNGLASLVVPGVTYNGNGCRKLRKHLLTDASIHAFYAFENRQKIFPIDSRYKFVCLVFGKEPAVPEGFPAAFMRHDPAELESPDPAADWMVEIRPDEIARLSPESHAFLEFRSVRDQEIIRKMYASGVTLGGDEPGNWGATLFADLAHQTIYHASKDKDLWTDPETGKPYNPRRILDSVPENRGDLIEAMFRQGFVPVYEGKHVDQYLLGIKPFRWWLDLDKCREKYGQRPRPHPTLMFRETASNTNERTSIAAVLPADAAASHKLSGLILHNLSEEIGATVLNSLVFDYALRMRTAGTNISFTYMRPMPVPPVDRLRDLPVIETRTAWDTGLEHITDDETLWPALWQANQAVAQAYGLDPHDLAHILQSFPGMARKRPEFTAYLRERIEC